MTASEITESSYLFGAFQLIPWRRLLRDGKLVALTPRALGVLSTLVEQHGQIVTKDELFAEVWRDVTVEDHNLTMQISILRKALAPGSIATFPGRGYTFKAAVERLPGAAPAQAAPGTNLPHRRATLIGRDAELTEVEDRIGRHRLVTVVGEGGIGKTRLAIAIGWRLATLFPDGVMRIDLAPLTDPAVVTSAAATTLGVALNGTAPPAEAIAAAIGRKRMLLIFDNCEYLASAAAALADVLLDRAPGLSVLATSQEPLHLAEEQIYRLRPLALPPAGAKDIAGFDAVALFVRRAQAADRRFVLDDDNADGVAEICRRLDGMPLALEMAAARLPLLGIGGLRARLDERLRLLGTGHRTLLAMVEWSHGLLDSGDQAVFRRLAVFPGSFSLDAAVAVTGATEAWPIVDTLGRLVDKSLVTVETGEPRRYRLLETLRLHAAEKLQASGENEATAEHHARFFTTLFDEADAAEENGTILDVAWMALYRPEIDNLRAALDWALAEPERAPVAVALAGGAGRLWSRLGLYGEGKRYAERAIPLIDQTMPGAVAARLLRQASVLWRGVDPARTLTLLERSAALYRQAAERKGLVDVLARIGNEYTLLGRLAEAVAVLDEGEEIVSSGNDKGTLITLMLTRGTLALAMKEPAEARRYYTIGLEQARAEKRILWENIFHTNLAEVEFQEGAIDQAIAHARAAATGVRAAGASDTSLLGWPLSNLASYLIARGDHVEARAYTAEALSLFLEEGGRLVQGCLRQGALIGALNGQHTAAAQLIGFVDAHHNRSGRLLEFTEQQLHDRLSTLLAAALPAADIEAHACDGAGWSERQAIDFAFEHLIAPEASPPLTRKATVSDLAAVVALKRAAYASYTEILGSPPLPVTEDYEPRIERGEVWLLEDDASLAGALVIELNPDHALIYSVAVAPDRQGAGHGLRLLRLADELAHAAGLAEMRLYTNARMTRNIALYTKFGYRETGRRASPYRPGWILVDMAKLNR
jgi:predicted ATPase/DNA-binding winged helix-turn-helix (wHTH) protein/ribosomal protein S18 acetylase RimI-like enzyme